MSEEANQITFGHGEEWPEDAMNGLVRAFGSDAAWIVARYLAEALFESTHLMAKPNCFDHAAEFGSERKRLADLMRPWVLEVAKQHGPITAVVALRNYADEWPYEFRELSAEEHRRIDAMPERQRRRAYRDATMVPRRRDSGDPAVYEPQEAEYLAAVEASMKDDDDAEESTVS